MINYLGISGGKDSTAALLWIVHESGYPRESLRVTFCNTHNEDPKTYAYLAMLAERVHPIITLEPSLGFNDLARERGRFPSTKARFCTIELKMFPTRADVEALTAQGHTVLMHTGIRAEESELRSKLEEREWDGFYGVDMYRPLLHWGIEDVYAMLAKYNIPRNPLYDEGARRVGCYPCIMSSKREIRNIAKTRPERIDEIRALESEIGSTFFAPNKIPMRFKNTAVTTRDGRVVKIATIDEVVKWSKTAMHRPDQFELDLDVENEVCPSVHGHCE